MNVKETKPVRTGLTEITYKYGITELGSTAYIHFIKPRLMNYSRIELKFRKP